MPRKERVLRAADGGALTKCAGCTGLPFISSNWLRPCAICHAEVCRVCRGGDHTNRPETDTCWKCAGRPEPGANPGKVA